MRPRETSTGIKAGYDSPVASMFEQRNLRLDVIALAVLAFVIFTALALVTYDRADQVAQLIAPLDRLYQADVLVYPLNAETQNVCGKWGAVAADLLLTTFGFGAYYLVLSLAIFDISLLRRRSIDVPVVRLFGWLISLIGLTSLSALLMPDISPGPMIGSGGYLGALGATFVQSRFALFGGFVLTFSMVVGGLLICTDYTLLRVAQMAFFGVVVGVAKGREFAEARRKRSDVEEFWEEGDEEEFDEADETRIKIRGGSSGVDVVEDEEDEVEEEEFSAEEENAEEDTDADSAVRDLVIKGKSVKARIDKQSPKSELRIKKSGKTQDERTQVMETLDAAVRQDETEEYALPDIDLLIQGDDVCFDEQEKEVRRKAKILEQTFENFGFKVRVVEIETGPVIAQYEVELEAGLRLAKITGLAEDLAIALRVPSVRIVAPIPGKNTVGIEVPNESRQIVRLRDVLEESNARANKMKIPIFLGKDVSGNPMTVDLASLPHLLIAGRTGTGKSVCLNAIISSILMSRRPDEVRMLMIDPKMVELCGYGRLPHLMHPVVTDMKKAEAILAWAVDKMEERYSLLAKAGVRHVSSYNQLGKEELAERLGADNEEGEEVPEHLPFIVIVADEMADLMMTAGKEVEQHIIRLAQKSRAVGIHLILATQKPTVDVITGLIKSNLPARIAFQVASRTDSRVVLDEMGADKLLGNGDMLFLWPGTSTLIRGQGTFLSDDEINAIVESVSTHEQDFVTELVNMQVEEAGEEQVNGLKKRDDLYESAVDIIVREGRGSVSLLQRSLGVGYGRAARLIDFMAEDGIVGPYAGSQAREVLISVSDWERMQGLEPEEETPAKPKRSNKVVPSVEVVSHFDEDDSAVSDDDEEAVATAEDEEGQEDAFEDDYDSDEYDDEEVEEYEDEVSAEEEDYEDEQDDYDEWDDSDHYEAESA